MNLDELKQNVPISDFLSLLGHHPVRPGRVEQSTGYHTGMTLRLPCRLMIGLDCGTTMGADREAACWIWR